MNRNILLIEDDADLIKLLKSPLEEKGYSIEVSETFDTSLEKARKKQPALILLDLILAGTYGLEICQALKKESKTAHIPILILSSRNQEADVLKGLEMGAEDYITKPFNPRIVLARVGRALGSQQLRNENSEKEIVHYGDFKVDPHRFELSCGSQMLSVTRSEFHILYLLFGRPGWVFTRKQILEATHGEETPVTPRSVDVMVVNIRHKLNSHGYLLETVRGVGYRARDLALKTQ